MFQYFIYKIYISSENIAGEKSSPQSVVSVATLKSNARRCRVEN